MEKKNFFNSESICQLRFSEAGYCFHVCTQENLPVLFHNDEKLKAVMNVIALICICSPEVKVYTFSVMGNHIHLLATGQTEAVRGFSQSVIKRLALHPLLRESQGDILKMEPRLHPIKDLNNIRNVIAYIHRNGPLVNPDESVFTYEWGCGRFYFNREAKARYKECRHLVGQVEKRILTKSHKLDNIDNIFTLDGYISPLCYCKVEEAELFFKDARQYFYKIAKNVESQKDIAAIIGENIFYTDYDLMDIVASACKKKFGVSNSSVLAPKDKMDLARILHYEYNAGNKQIARLLKLNLETISSMFPK